MEAHYLYNPSGLHRSKCSAKSTFSDIQTQWTETTSTNYSNTGKCFIERDFVLFVVIPVSPLYLLQILQGLL